MAFLEINLPFEDMYEKYSDRLFHRLYRNTDLRGHRGVGLFQWIEIKYDIQNFTGKIGTGSYQSCEGVYGSINKYSITVIMSK